jgi:hypothetical protein
LFSIGAGFAAFAVTRGSGVKGKDQSSNSIGMTLIFWAVFIGVFLSGM